MRKILSLIICFGIIISNFSIPILAQEDLETSEETSFFDEFLGTIAGVSQGSVKIVQVMLEQAKFHTAKGHGFAAEVGNHYADLAAGLDAEIVGNNNLHNGPDRVIRLNKNTSIFIQTKYYKTASESIAACFENGEYRYVNGDGTPMIIEVPKDQYDDAIRAMQNRIASGQMKNVGITNPSEAENYVRAGSLDYKQAQNLAKAGTVDSLLFDARTGIISSTCAMGISTVINFAVNKLNGMDTNDAVKASVIDGLKTGGTVFVTHIIAAQLGKANVVKVFEPSAKALTNAFGNDFANALINAYGGSLDDAASLATTATKILQNQMLIQAVTVVVLTADDVVELFQGRISKEQLIKNVVTTTAGIAGGSVGYVAGSSLGTAIAPGAGTTIGGITGSVLIGAVTGIGTELIIGWFYEDDADQMMNIISTEFQEMCENYLINEEEGDELASILQEKLDTNCLKEMFASEDRELFANELMLPLFEEVASNRETIITPTEEEMREEMKKTLDGVVFVH